MVRRVKQLWEGEVLQECARTKPKSSTHRRSRRVGHDFGGMSLNTCSIELEDRPPPLSCQLDTPDRLGMAVGRGRLQGREEEEEE